MMFKYTYFITYSVGTNRKSGGTEHAMSIVLNSNLDKAVQQSKVLRMLCVIHRTDVGGIVLKKYVKISRVFVPMQRVRAALSAFFTRIKEFIL